MRAQTGCGCCLRGRLLRFSRYGPGLAGTTPREKQKMSRTLKAALLGATAFFAATQFAAAADLGARPYQAAPVAAPVPYFNWTGFYIGANAGYGWGDAKDPTGAKMDIDGW